VFLLQFSLLEWESNYVSVALELKVVEVTIMEERVKKFRQSWREDEESEEVSTNKEREEVTTSWESLLLSFFLVLTSSSTPTSQIKYKYLSINVKDKYIIK
jgi:hypothetical protein